MTKFKNYCVTVSPILHKKIDKHVSVFKNLLKQELRKQDWIIEAIKEKLERDVPSQEIIKEKSMGLHLDPLLHQRIGKHVDMKRQFHFSFSKNKWILDAIQERLDQETENVYAKLDQGK